MEARRRQPSTSASVYSEDNRQNHRNAASHSATPAGEDDTDDTPKRSTRGRNPLPPSTGPLFPPLPPKQPKSRSNSTRMPVKPPVPDENPSSDIVKPEDIKVADAVNDIREAELGSPSGSKPDLPSGSAASLTPPPPTSEDAALDQEDSVQPANEDDEAPAGPAPMDDPAEVSESEGVKLETEDVAKDADPQETPKRNGRTRAQGENGEATPPVPERTDSGGRLGRKRRGEEQLLLDDHLLPEEMRRGAALASKRKGEIKDEEAEEEPVGDEAQEEEEEENAEEGRVRCVCKTEDPDIMMIQCDKCLVWQHGPCMGVWNDDEAPDEYYCDECRPDLHAPLRKYIRSLGRNPTSYTTPTPADLENHHYSHDKNPPSQSKRWKVPNQLKPTKSLPASRQRKEAASPVESTDGKRSARDRDRHTSQAQSAATSSRHAPISANKAPPSGKQHEPKKRTESSNKRVIPATSPSPSHSPPPHGQSHKRRSTMNSRDAAYEEQVKAALEASKMDSTEVAVEDEPEAMSEARDNEVEDIGEAAPIRKPKRKREDDDDLSDATGTSNKPKHPNQYTYRPKPISNVQAVPSPVRRVGQASTPIPTLPPPAQHEHGTRRAGAIANGIIPPPPNSISVHNLHWHLPDHLSAFADILPGPHPLPTEARAPRSLAYLPRSHFLNQKYGPLGEDRDDQRRLILPNDTAPREITGDSNTQLEPPARVRYPAKRITTAEMKKRVRNLLEYASRVQVEESRRRERANLMGIDLNRLPKAVHLDKNGNAISEADEESRQEAVRTGPVRKSVAMLDELVNDLIVLQEGLNGLQGGLGMGVSPAPPSLSVFAPSVPVTPTVPTATTMESTSQADEVANGYEDISEQIGVTPITVNGVDQSQNQVQPEPDELQDEDGWPSIEDLPEEIADSGMDLDVPMEDAVYPTSTMDTDAAARALLGMPQSDSPVLATDPKSSLPELAASGLEDITDQATFGAADYAMMDKSHLAVDGNDIVIEDAQVPVEVYRQGEVNEVATQPEEVDMDVAM